MKKLCVLIMTVGVFLGCASGVKAPAVSGLVSLDDALAGAVTEVSSKVQGKTEIVIAAIDTSLLGVSEFLSDELAGLLVSSGKFVILERGPALDALTAEHGVQMSGLVSDESAVGIGHYLGAKVVLTGTFTSFADFSQIRVRAIDVRTSEILTLYNMRILPNDRILANVMQQHGQNIPVQAVTEDALAHLNRGIDLFNEGKYEAAIEEFNKALAINRNLAEAYYHRANTRYELFLEGRYDWDDDDWERMEPVFGLERDWDWDDFSEVFIADYTRAITLKPDYVDALFNRGYIYREGLVSIQKKDYDRAIVDFTAALRIKPDHIGVLHARGYSYVFTDNYDRAIADFTAILRMNPNDSAALFNRGGVYASMGDLEKAIADFEACSRISSNGLGRSDAERLRQRMQQ